MNSLTPSKLSRPKDISSSQASNMEKPGGRWQPSRFTPTQKASRKVPRQMQDLSSTSKLLKSHLSQKKAKSRLDNKTPLTASSLRKSNLSHRKQQSLQEQEDKRNKECTFHPQISAYPLKQNFSISEKIELLSIPNTYKFDLREKTKWNQDVPQESILEISGSFATERLFQHALFKHEHREKTLRKISDSLNACSFKPKTSPNPKQNAPLYKRATQVQKARAKYHLNLQQDALSKPEFTYKPTISEQSKRLASARRIKSSQVKTHETEQIVSKPELKVKKTTVKAAYNSTHRKTSTTTNTPSHTFRPTICETSRFLIETNKYKKAETFKDKVNRLSQHKKTLKQEEPKFSFSPKIDVISKQLGRSYSTHSQVFKPEEPSFKPQTSTNKKFKNLQSAYKQGSNVIQEINVKNTMRQQKLNMIRMSQEYLDIKDCTFQPEVCENRLNIYRYAEVKGKDRFMEIKEMADRLRMSKSFTFGKK